jgi:hypothetical protein
VLEEEPMGCASLVVAALLALAVPASIARTSLIGAYVVIALLAAAGVTYVLIAGRRRAVLLSDDERPSTALIRIAVLTVVYTAVVTLIHVTA